MHCMGYLLGPSLDVRGCMANCTGRSTVRRRHAKLSYQPTDDASIVIGWADAWTSWVRRSITLSEMSAPGFEEARDTAERTVHFPFVSLEHVLHTRDLRSRARDFATYTHSIATLVWPLEAARLSSCAVLGSGCIAVRVQGRRVARLLTGQECVLKPQPAQRARKGMRYTSRVATARHRDACSVTASALCCLCAPPGSNRRVVNVMCCHLVAKPRGACRHGTQCCRQPDYGA